MAYRTHGGEPFHYVVRSYDERGRVEALMRFTENLGFDAVYYRYNSMNKVVSVHTLDAAGQHAAFYSYDHNGRMEAMWTVHSHLGLGELIFNQPAVSVRCVRAALLSRDPLAAADMTWSYDAADAIAGVTYPSVTGGIQTTITRNERGMLMRQNTTSSAPLAPSIFDQRINYRLDGLIDMTWAQSGMETQWSFQYYDGAHRLYHENTHVNGNPGYSSHLTLDRIGNRRTEQRNGNVPLAQYAFPPLPLGPQQPRHMNALMSITAGQDSDARTYTSDGALATRAVMRTSANGSTQRLEAWGYSALSLPEWYSLRSDAAAAGSTCTPDATLAPQHLWRYRYGPQQEREQKREWENGSATQPLHWTYWLLGADGKQLVTYHGVQGATCGGAATDVALWPVEYAAYAPLGTRVITRSNGTKEIVLADHLGSSRVVLAQQGYIAQSTAYTAYGEISHTEGDGARTGYIGRFAEPEGSFNLHGVRFYDADAGSFTAVDPLWSKYAAWTPYQYAQAEPMRRVDWSGFGDFVNEFGSKVGSDGRDDGELYLANQATYDEMKILGTKVDSWHLQKGVYPVPSRDALALLAKQVLGPSHSGNTRYEYGGVLTVDDDFIPGLSGERSQSEMNPWPAIEGAIEAGMLIQYFVHSHINYGLNGKESSKVGNKFPSESDRAILQFLYKSGYETAGIVIYPEVFMDHSMVTFYSRLDKQHDVRVVWDVLAKLRGFQK